MRERCPTIWRRERRWGAHVVCFDTKTSRDSPLVHVVSLMLPLFSSAPPVCFLRGIFPPLRIEITGVRW